MEQIETLRYDEKGYKSLVFFENWRVALMNDGPKTNLEGLSYFQKHGAGQYVQCKKGRLAHPLFCTEYQGCNSGKCRYSSRKFTNQQLNG